MYLVSTEPDITRIEQLKNKRIALPGRHGLYDELFRHLMIKSGLTPGVDIELVYMGSPLEAMQWLHAGEVDMALLAEPQCSAALLKKSAKPLYRSLSIGEIRKMVDGDDHVPMAGIMVHQRVINHRPDIVSALRVALQQSVDWTIENPKAAAQAASSHLSMPTPILESAIPNSRLTAANAKDHHEILKNYFKMVESFKPELIGGKVPDDAFYI